MKDLIRIAALASLFGGLAATASAQPACWRCLQQDPWSYGICYQVQNSPGSTWCVPQAYGQCNMGPTCELTVAELDASAVVHREPRALVEPAPPTTGKLGLVVPRATLAPGSFPRVGCGGIIVGRRMSAEGIAFMRRTARQIRV